MVEWKFKNSGLPVDYKLNKIIKAIEKTPQDEFSFGNIDNQTNSTIDFRKLSGKQKSAYFKKNPQSIFHYRNPQLGTHSVFTNFKVGIRNNSNVLYYDNIRLHYNFYEFPNAKNGKELMRVRAIIRHSGLSLYEGRDWSSWRIIDFLNPELVSESFMNWDKEPWSDLK